MKRRRENLDRIAGRRRIEVIALGIHREIDPPVYMSQTRGLPVGDGSGTEGSRHEPRRGDGAEVIGALQIDRGRALHRPRARDDGRAAGD